LAQQLPLFEGAAPVFGLVGDTPEIQRVLRVIQKLRNSRSPVLLLGETGTGKEVAARALHEVSPGRRGVFVAVNLASLPPTLIESELFGHVRGSFTGAAGPRRGLMEQADGGTLFLDEIGELPMELQPKLLRALEEKQVRPLGAERSVLLEIRVIAATNRDLKADVERERFRADLFYRLNVITIRLPPLRERRGDIPLLARHFLEQHAGRPVRLTREAMRCLVEFDWPGNVRQLENAIERMVELSSSPELDADSLPSEVRNAVQGRAGMEPRPALGPASVEVAPLAEVERMQIERAMKIARGDCRKAAKILGIGRTTLYRKLKQFGQQFGRAASA